MAGQLRGAIHRREITVLYQPKVDLKTNEICGLEALVRWRHPRFGLLGPDEFVPAAERNGAIQPLTPRRPGAGGVALPANGGTSGWTSRSP